MNADRYDMVSQQMGARLGKLESLLPRSMKFDGTKTQDTRLRFNL